MKKVSLSQKKIVGIFTAIVAIITIALTILQLVSSSTLDKDPALLTALTYTQYVDGDGHEDVYAYDSNTGEVTDTVVENVEFSAFFLQDLDSDGYAESINGTCNEIGDSKILYMELNVLTGGYLTNATITINGENFYFYTALPEDNEYLTSYISTNTGTIGFKDIVAGTQKTITGSVRSGNYSSTSTTAAAIGSNINNYSRDDNTIVLTGTYVDENGIETEIYKEISLTVDWYGETTAKVYATSNKSSSLTYYDISSRVDEDAETFTTNFTIYALETKNELLLDTNVTTATIPQLNGYDPISVTVTTSNVDYEYDEETGVLTITRTSTVDDSGNVTTSLSRGNSYAVTVVYPLEAYETIGSESVTIKIPVTTYYTGYNNDSGEFDNPYTSNVATATISATYRNPVGTVADIDITVGKYVTSPSSRYIVSKEKPLKIYNGVSEEETDDTYLVRWYLYTGSDGSTSGATLEENRTTYASDQFITSDGSYISMDDLTTNIGIYFSGASNLLGSDGWIKVYDADSGELLVTFTSDGADGTESWSTFSSSAPYYYEYPVNHIKIETSSTNASSYIYVYNIKELDDAYITENFTMEEFDALSYIYSTLKGTIGGSSLGTDSARANYEAPYSIATISLSTGTMSTQVTTENEIIKISATASTAYNQIGWLNGSYLVILPAGVLTVDINDVTINDSNVEIVSYEVVEIVDGDTTYQAIKINTNNVTDTAKSYTISIDCDITPDPRITSTNGTVKLYASNEETSYYYYTATDVYDVNDNLNTTEKVNYRTTTLSLVAPNTVITNETISDFDDTGAEVISPQVADITPIYASVDNENNTATIGVNVTNNYSNDITDIVILGRIPFEGNDYVISGADLGSTYTTILTGPLVIPDELQGYVTVYYSTNGSATKDVDDADNGWVTEDEVSDWSDILSYLVVFDNDFVMETGDTYTVYYEVEIPSDTEFNEISYSHHGVYFSLVTEDGKYATKAEPNRIGLMVAQKYDLQLTKYQIDSDILVAGATYKLTEVELDDDGNVETEVSSSTATTSESGTLTISNLYAGRYYTLQEIKTPDNYELNDDVILFTCDVDSEGVATIDVISGTTRDTFTISNTGDGYVATVAVEDEVRATIKIAKTESSTSTAMQNVRFKVTGANYTSGKVVTTGSDGTVTLSGLSIGEEYTLTETKTNTGYYLIQEPITFVIENNSGVYSLNITSDAENTSSIGEVTTENGIPTLTINITNDIIPTYNIEILKIEDNDTEQEGLENARFQLYSEDLGTYTYLNTGEDGKLTFEGLYSYVDGRYITGNYTITEILAPDGYVASGETISFYVELVDGVNTVHITNTSELYSLVSYDATSTTGTISMVIQNTPQFKLSKVSGEDGTAQPGAKFILYEVTSTGRIIDYAKDPEGNYIGELNSQGRYIITTDENGEYTAALASGYYKLVEIEAPEGYALAEAQYFRIDSDDDEEEAISLASTSTTADLYISSIEDLVAFATDGNTYSGQTVELTRSLDFNDEDSYEDPSNMGTLTYTPKASFHGTFLGNEYTISNLSITSTISSQSGLFAYAYGATISDITLENLTISVSAGAYVGGIVGYSYNTTISNCSTSGTITDTNGTVNRIGGITGYTYYTTIIGCSNKIDINATGASQTNFAGGITGYTYYSTVINCYNEGNITNISATSYARVGGIASNSFDTYIINCYNNGDLSARTTTTSYVTSSSMGSVYGTYVGGIASGLEGGTIENCYSVGSVSGTAGVSSNLYVGGIIGYFSQGNLVNTYYLETVADSGTGHGTDTTTSMTNAEMMSSDFVRELNSNVETLELSGEYDEDLLKWTNSNTYPVFAYMELAVLEPVTEITVTDELLTYIITTEIGENSEGERTGGTITGSYTDSYPESNNIQYVETVKYEYDAENNIVITPSDGYYVLSVTLDGEEVSFVPDSEGIVTLPALTSVTDNHHYVVVFEKQDTQLTINKVDSATGDALENVTFSIDQVEERDEITSATEEEIFGDLTNNGATYTYTDTSENVTDSTLGELTANSKTYYDGLVAAGTYYFVKQTDGTLIPTNSKTYLGTSYGYSGTANSYVKIDLSDYEGTYYVVVNASVSSRSSYDYGYATILSSNSSVPSYSSSTGRFMYISGTVDATDYTSTALTGGNVYYLYLGYRKYSTSSSGNDQVVINSINVINSDNETAIAYSELISDEPSTYCFEDQGDGTLINNNQNQDGTVANSYMEIDLTGYTGEYRLTINAQISSQSSYDYGYATITSDTTAPAYSSSTGRFIYISGTTSATDYTTSLQGGSVYYLHLGYYKNASTSSGTDTFTINSINIYGTYDMTYYFEENTDGTLTSNNQNVNSTVANSYMEIDLTDYTGKYNLVVNANISSQSGYDIGYATITSDTTAPSYSSSTGRFIYISGTTTPTDYTTVLEGGSVYYLHLGYYKNSSTSTGTDTFTINSIHLELNDSELYHTTATTNASGVAYANVQFGIYTITETTTPDGYDTIDPVTITFRADEKNVVSNVSYASYDEATNTYTIENTPYGNLIVRHVLLDSDGNIALDDDGNVIYVAETETYSGSDGESYTTAPTLDLTEYQIATNAEVSSELREDNGTGSDDSYYIPSNSYGTYVSNEIIVVTYYYVVKDVPLTVYHYIEGTETPVPTSSSDVQTTVTDSGTEGDPYTTSSLTAEELASDYELVETPDNAEGTYEYSEVIVTYLYAVVQRDLTINKVDEDGNALSGVTFTITDSSGDLVGTYITDSNGQITVTLEVGTYTVEETATISGYELNTETQDITITKDAESYSLEFVNEYTRGNVIVHHYIEGTEIQVPSSSGGTVADEEKTGKVGDTYATKASDEIAQNYELVSNTSNTSGEYIDGTIVVIYYYKAIYIDIDSEITKTGEVEDGTDTITEEGQSITYTINYTASIEDYIGDTLITIVDYLPYQIESDYTYSATVNGSAVNLLSTKDSNNIEYDKVNKTITFYIEVDDVNTYLQQNDEIDIEITLTVTYKDVNYGQESITNEVIGEIDLLDEDRTEETDPSEETIDIDIRTSVTGTKTWIDESSSTRPASITINLLRNGEKVDSKSVEVSTSNTMTYTFESVLKYASDGTEYEYTVEEEAVSGYETIIDDTGLNITNIEKISIPVTKNWVDNGNAYLTRPSSITVKLLQNNTQIDEVEISDDGQGNWSYTFENLRKYSEAGEKYVYTIEEDAVEGYTSTISGYEITNTIEQDYTDITVTKTWQTEDNIDSLNTTIYLYRDGATEPLQTASIKGDGDYTFRNLEMYDLTDGHKYVYTVDEEKVDGYEASVDSTGLNFTNTKVGITSISVEKEWVDDGNSYGSRPSEITVTLLANGVSTGQTATLSSTNSWSYTFENLDAYNEKGRAISYTVEESELENYTAQTYDTSTGYRIVNTIAQEYVEVSGTKTWNTIEDVDSLKATIELYQDNVKIDKTTVLGNGTYTFSKLDKYDLTDGHIYTYTVKEVEVENYSTTISGYDVTNSYLGTEAEIENEITKVADKEVITSEDEVITYDITYDVSIENYLGKATITIVDYLPCAIDESLSDLAGGTYNSENNTITWTEEVTVGSTGYINTFMKEISVVYSNQDVTTDIVNTVKGTTITYYPDSNPTNPGEPRVTVEDEASETVEQVYKVYQQVIKVWDDNENEKGHRPSSVNVTLYADGVATDQTVTLSERNNWTYTFDDLDKYDASGNRISYTVVETEVEEDELEYYSDAQITYGEEYTEIKNSYNAKEPEIDSSISKTATESITSASDVITYEIAYTATIKEYIGEATLTVVDTLPYEIVTDKSDLSDGVYDSSNKTVTWTVDLGHINTDKNGEFVVTFNKTITVVYGSNLELPISTITNNVAATINLAETNTSKTDEDDAPTNAQIPGKVTVKYVDKDTGEEIADGESQEGMAGDPYTTEQKSIEYYVFVESTDNTSGELTEEGEEVIYYYRKMTFNLAVNKEIASITQNGVTSGKNSNIVKAEVGRKEIESTTITVTYKITVSNTSELKGTATVVDYLPSYFTVASSNPSYWVTTSDGNLSTYVELDAGASTELTVVLNWVAGESNFGTLTNKVEIVDPENPAKYPETTTADNTSSADLVLSVRTGLTVAKELSPVVLPILVAICIVLIVIKKRKATGNK